MSMSSTKLVNLLEHLAAGELKAKVCLSGYSPSAWKHDCNDIKKYMWSDE